MTYRLENDTKYLGIITTLSIQRILKATVVGIDTIGTLYVKLDLGDPMKDIYLNYKEVTFPDAVSNENLRDSILGWLNS